MKIIVNGKIKSILTRADMEKYTPNLLRALDNIAKADLKRDGNEDPE